jgi:small subunit ribosomal protein S29
MTDVLKNPKNITQIIEAGLNNPEYATCAMAEVLQQVYESDQHVCELVDGYTHFYRQSWYRSFKYFNDRGLFGYIPPYHIAHCRLFIHLDGHKLKNGFKVVTSSNYPLHKHKFDIKKIMFP